MKRVARALAFSAACAALAGCTALPPEDTEPVLPPHMEPVLPPGTQEVLALDEVIAEVLVAAAAPESEQTAALARAEDRFLRERTPPDRVRLATLLATLPVPLRDEGRALELLAPIADAGSPGAGRFAALLSAYVAERQRLEREAERMHRESERLARERERAEKERARVERDRERIERERDKREETLKQQLEALRSIERGILEREERLRRKPR
jgi:hypothetical protein